LLIRIEQLGLSCLDKRLAVILANGGATTVREPAAIMRLPIGGGKGRSVIPGISHSFGS